MFNNAKIIKCLPIEKGAIERGDLEFAPSERINT